MRELAQLHTIVRAQVRSDDRRPHLQGDAAIEATLPPITRRALLAWRRERGRAGSGAARWCPRAGSDEWTSPSPDER